MNTSILIVMRLVALSYYAQMLQLRQLSVERLYSFRISGCQLKAYCNAIGDVSNKLSCTSSMTVLKTGI